MNEKKKPKNIDVNLKSEKGVRKGSQIICPFAHLCQKHAQTTNFSTKRGLQHVLFYLTCFSQSSE